MDEISSKDWEIIKIILVSFGVFIFFNVAYIIDKLRKKSWKVEKKKKLYPLL